MTWWWFLAAFSIYLSFSQCDLLQDTLKLLYENDFAHWAKKVWRQICGDGVHTAVCLHIGRVGLPPELSIPLIHTGMCSQITWVSEAPLRLTDLQISHTDQYKVHRAHGGRGQALSCYRGGARRAGLMQSYILWQDHRVKCGGLWSSSRPQILSSGFLPLSFSKNVGESG